jgi:hypothetical protein
VWHFVLGTVAALANQSTTPQSKRELFLGLLRPWEQSRSIPQQEWASLGYMCGTPSRQGHENLQYLVSDSICVPP